MQQKNTSTKTVKESITWNIIMYTLLIISMCICISISFWLMNMPYTAAFIIGIILFVLSIVFPIELVVKYNIRKNKKNNQTTNK